jgi:hypothetical protein
LRAAVLCAEDELTDTQIAETVGVSRSTLNRWRELPEFRDEIVRQDAAILAKALRLPIAKKYRRLSVLNDLHEKALAVIDARQQEYADNPQAIGGQTGLIVKDIKAVGSGRDQEIVEVWGFDRSLVSEIRGLQEQAARETGDWSENVNLTGGLTATVRLVGVDPGDI